MLEMHHIVASECVLSFMHCLCAALLCFAYVQCVCDGFRSAVFCYSEEKATFFAHCSLLLNR